MTATITSKGYIVLRTSAREKVSVKPGDVLVASGGKGRIVLRKQRKGWRDSRKRVRTNYLTPPPLSPRVLERVYAESNPEWDKVEAEAVALSERSLKGKRIEQL